MTADFGFARPVNILLYRSALSYLSNVSFPFEVVSEHDT